MSKIEEILSFWFGPLDEQGMSAPERAKFWFMGGPEADRQIQERFGDDLNKAMEGVYDEWADTIRGRLALIILLDQFTRNCFRKTAKAFSQDAKARELTRTAIAAGDDLKLQPVERCFFYLPLEHSEELADQDACVAAFERLVQGFQGNPPGFVTGSLEYAVDHRDIIRRFGRFPHRNPVLGRTHTAEELAYLKETGNTFGQG